MTSQLKRKTTSAEVAALKIEMITRELTQFALAERAGLHILTLRNVLCGSNKTWPPRDKINRALKTVIFHKPKHTHSKKTNAPL